jgi:hypothetical protein
MKPPKYPLKAKLSLVHLLFLLFDADKDFYLGLSNEIIILNTIQQIGVKKNTIKVVSITMPISLSLFLASLLMSTPHLLQNRSLYEQE